MHSIEVLTERLDYEESWSECGELYLLKLFFEYLFDQFDQEGKRLVDGGFVLNALNKVSFTMLTCSWR